MTLEEVRKEMNMGTPKNDCLMSNDLQRYHEMVVQFGGDGLFYALGIAYNKGYADALKYVKKQIKNAL